MPARLDFGCVWVNTHIPLVAEMPHGGFKHSGYGKDLSMYSLEDYTRVKHVMQHHGFEGWGARPTSRERVPDRATRLTRSGCRHSGSRGGGE